MRLQFLDCGDRVLEAASRGFLLIISTFLVLWPDRKNGTDYRPGFTPWYESDLENSVRYFLCDLTRLC